MAARTLACGCVIDGYKVVSRCVIHGPGQWGPDGHHLVVTIGRSEGAHAMACPACREAADQDSGDYFDNFVDGRG